MELTDERGPVLARKRLPEGVAGMARLHELIGEQLGEDADDAEVIIGTGTDRGPWVAALVTAGYTVYGANPLQASRYRERHGGSGAKSDTGDAHMLTGMAHTDSRQLRAVAGDSPGAGAVKVVARTRKTGLRVPRQPACAAARSGAPSRRKPTRSATARTKAAPAAGRPPSTPDCTSSATPWNAALTASSATAPPPPAMTS